MLAKLALAFLATTPLSAPPPAPREEIEDATVVLEDGEVVTGDFTVRRRKGKKLGVRSGKGRYKAADLVLDANDGFFYPEAPGLPELDAIRALVAHRVGAGAVPADLLCALRNRLPPASTELATALLREALLDAPDHEEACGAFAKLERTERVALARELLAAEPLHAAAAAAVRALLPEGLDPGASFDPLEWLAFLDAVDRVGITVVVDRPDPPPELEEDVHWLRVARRTKTWGRTDLIGYRSEHVHLVTPLADPGLVASCLEQAEAVVALLEELFEGAPELRPSRYPLAIFLHESEDEYDEQSARYQGRKAHTSHPSDAGRYYDNDGVSRLFPPSGRTGPARLLRTLSHELTHHWLSKACRAFTNEDLMHATRRWRSTSLGGDTRPGHWVSEGLACLVEECLPVGERPQPASYYPDAHRFGVVASAPAEALVPWERTFSTSHLDAKGLDHTAKVEVPCSGDGSWTVSERSLYIAQATAACGFLYEGGEPGARAALTKLVAAYERGAPLSVEEACGFTPDELGERAVAHASRRSSSARRR